MTLRSHRPSPKLMYRDPEFIESPAARPMRIMAEYFDPLTRLRREHIGDTIVMFGSARILPKDRAAARLKAAGIGQFEDLGVDTYVDEARCFSYRRSVHRQEADYGRLLAAIVLS